MSTVEKSEISRRRISAGGVLAALVAVAMPVGAGVIASEAFAQSDYRPPAGSLVIGGENQNERVFGQGRFVLVSGSGNHVLIRGGTTTVRVTGSNNEVRVYGVRQIEVSGSNNKVFYVRGPEGGARVYQRAYNEVRQDPGAV